MITTVKIGVSMVALVFFFSLFNVTDLSILLVSLTSYIPYLQDFFGFMNSFLNPIVVYSCVKFVFVLNGIAYTIKIFDFVWKKLPIAK